MSVNNQIVAADEDFVLYRGDTWSQRLTIVQDDGSDTPYDLSGADIILQAKTDPDIDTSVLSLSVGAGITIGGADNNEISITSVVDVEPGEYVYDLQVTLNDVVTTYLKGRIIVKSDISR